MHREREGACSVEFRGRAMCFSMGRATLKGAVQCRGKGRAVSRQGRAESIAVLAEQLEHPPPVEYIFFHNLMTKLTAKMLFCSPRKQKMQNRVVSFVARI